MTKNGWQQAEKMLEAYERGGQCMPQEAGEKTPSPTHALLAQAATDTDRFFHEIVVCLGGIFATNDVSDSVVHQVTHGLHRLYLREHCRRFDRFSSVEHGSAPPASAAQQHDGLHPAVESLLRQIGR